MATKKVSIITAAAPWEGNGSTESVPAAPEAGATLGQYKLLERISEDFLAELP